MGKLYGFSFVRDNIVQEKISYGGTACLTSV